MTNDSQFGDLTDSAQLQSADEPAFSGERGDDTEQDQTGDNRPGAQSGGALETSVGWAGLQSLFAGSTAASWYLSLLFHVGGYVIAAAIFTWLGLNLIPEETVLDAPQIQASLADTTLLDELPALEIVQTFGPDTDRSEPSLAQIASQLTVDDRGEIDMVVDDAKLAVSGSPDATETAGSEAGFFRVPESGLAVTKGSFTAWTDPANPEPHEPYQIIIEVRLPDRLTRYRLSDLSGRVNGTDRYTQRLPFDPGKPRAARVTAGAAPVTVKRSTVVKLTGGKVQLAVTVPGAVRKVRDTIRIKSRRLKEEQKITLQFGVPQDD